MISGTHIAYNTGSLAPGLHTLAGNLTDAFDPESLQPRVEAECSLEWITLRDKGTSRAS